MNGLPSDLAQAHCLPYTGSGAERPVRLAGADLDALAARVPGWDRPAGGTLGRTFTFADFKAALAFVNAVGAIAEAENHHPDITIRYAKVLIELTTHDVGGLSFNDFVVAAKIDRLAPAEAVGV